MRKHVRKLLKNELFLMMMNGVVAYVAFTAVILTTLELPPEAILESGLDEVILVFEG